MAGGIGHGREGERGAVGGSRQLCWGGGGGEGGGRTRTGGGGGFGLGPPWSGGKKGEREMGKRKGAPRVISQRGGGGWGGKGSGISRSTSVKTVTSARCYHTHQVTVTPYHWSSTTGWTKYAAPKKTVRDSYPCH